MRLVRLDGLADPRFVDRDLYGAIGDHRLLRASGLFIAEGRLVVSRLIERHARLVRSLLLNAPAYTALESECARLNDNVAAFLCETRDFETLTGYDLHRGCLALAARLPDRRVKEIVASARTLVVVEELSNADNVGGIFRNAAAFGVDGVVLSSGCADPLYRKAVRTSMAAVLSVPFAIVSRQTEWSATLAMLRNSGFRVVALTPDASAVDVAAFATGSAYERIALLVGTEGAGLTEESKAAADIRIRIPIRTEIDSLNVAVATGIALHRLAKNHD